MAFMAPAQVQQQNEDPLEAMFMMEEKGARETSKAFGEPVSSSASKERKAWDKGPNDAKTESLPAMFDDETSPNDIQ